MNKAKALIITLIFFFGFFAKAQQTEVYSEPQRMFNDAMDLYERQVYASAQEMFGRILEQSGLVTELRSESAFYYAASSYFLNNEDALEQLIRFTEVHGASRHLNDAWFFIGNTYFSNKKYKDAVDYYSKIDPQFLPPEMLSQYYFNTGYVLMEQGQNEAAIQNFNKITAAENPDYYERAVFYKAYIYYQSEQFDAALPLFMSLKNTKDFSGSVPIYILDIYHRTGDYETVAKEGAALFESAPKDRRAQVAAVIADAFFKIDDYENAKKYLDLYRKGNKRMSRTQNYQYGYITFLDGQYAEAIKIFTPITTSNDAITQSAYFHIALAQLKTDKKKEAQRNFYLAYQMDFDPKIKEDALFNYAKLTYDLSFDPYKEAFKALKEFLEQYPTSRRVEEANQYIVNLAVSTKNYIDAIAALQQISHKTPEIQAAEQRLCYMYAVELFTQKRYTQAIDWFEKATESNAIKNMAAESRYWIAESYYRMNRYPEAKRQYQQFAAMKDAASLKYFNDIAYNLGYIAMNQGNYNEAQNHFQTFVSQKNNDQDAMKQDAYIRLADCFFMSKSFGKAIEYYTNAIDNGAPNADYAMYQKAMCYGAQKQFQEKITQLNQLISSYPTSLLHRDAVYEIAITLLLIDREQEALSYFDRITKNYPNSNIALKSLLRKGQALYNSGNSEQALNTLKQAVSEYPNTPQAQEALVIIKNIYLDMNTPDAYIKYAAGVPFASMTADEKETLLFNSAEQSYLEGNKEQAESSLKSFLEQYPQGVYSNMARWYYADCAMFFQKYDLALQEYEILVQNDKTENGRKALAITADLYYRQKDFEKALARYNAALANEKNEQDKSDLLVGIMRCYEQMDDAKRLKSAASNVLQVKNLPETVATEAHLNLARASFDLKDYTTAEKEYAIVKKTATGAPLAEASYFAAWSLYKKSQYDQSIEAAFDLINDFPSEDFWLVKSFLLLADNYIAKKNYFQAEQTLNSIIENCQIPELKSEAEKKLESIEGK